MTSDSSSLASEVWGSFTGVSGMPERPGRDRALARILPAEFNRSRPLERRSPRDELEALQFESCTGQQQVGLGPGRRCVAVEKRALP